MRHWENTYQLPPPKVYNSLVTDFKDIEMEEMPDKELKRMMLRMINKFKENTNKQLNEIRKMMQDMEE